MRVVLLVCAGSCSLSKESCEGSKNVETSDGLIMYEGESSLVYRKSHAREDKTSRRRMDLIIYEGESSWDR